MKPKRVLAVASGGGHWVQLLRLRPAFAHHEVTYMTTNADFAVDVGRPVLVVIDANLTKKLAVLKLFAQMLRHMLSVRPDIVITTGAAPGFAAVVCGRLLRARTIWVDSIANAEQLSQSGEAARRWADLWLTQWPDLARPDGPQYWGRVL